MHTRQDFSRELTLLRERSGMTVRQVAAKVGVQGAHSTIGDWFSGRGLPSTTSRDLLTRVLTVCGVDDAGLVEQWLQAWLRVRRVPGRRTGGPEPYRGLASYQSEDADWFFGRDVLTGQLIARLADLRAARGGVQVVVGASGSGKSSLVQAGMIPALRAGRMPGSALWPVVLFTPGSRPTDELAAHLAERIGVSASEVAEAIQADPGRCTQYVSHAAAAGGSGDDDPDAGERPDSVGRVSNGCQLIVVIDQFEEVFTTCAEEEQRQAFITALCAAASGGALVVVSLRADFYAQALRYPQLVAAVQASQLAVGPMSEAELREAIVGPARKAKLDIEDGLVELLLRDIASHGGSGEGAHEAGALPLLSHALYATWRQARGSRLTIADYHAVGGIDGAVAASASGVYDMLTDHQRELARRLFLSLVHVAPDTADTRRRVTTAELLAKYRTVAAAEMDDVLDRFIAQRLITADTGTVEISHEALLTAWPQLRTWLDTDRAGLVIGRRLDEAAATWHRENRDPAALYRGARLAAAAEWAETAGPHTDLTPRAREFLDASIQRELVEQRAARRRTRRLRQLVASLSVLLVTTTVAAVAAVRSQQTASEQRNTAISRKVAGDATALRVANPALAVQLSLAAYRLAPTVEARSSLFSSFGTPYATRLTGHTSGVNAVRFSPDGRTLATGSSDRTARLWDVTNPHRPHELSILAGHDDWVALAFAPDGHTLATADGALRLWDITDPRHPTTLATQFGDLHTWAIAFSPDGSALATGRGNDTAQLWDITDPRHPRESATLTGHTEPVNTVTFSPDGETLATTSLDHTVRLWNVADRRHPTMLAAFAVYADLVYAAAFSPDGRVLATASSDHTVRLWDITNRRHPVTSALINGHTDAVRALAFSPDGRTLATASADNTVRVWDITDQRHPYERTVLTSHTGGAIDTNAVTSVAFHPDGRTLASASSDHTARLWDLPGPMLTGRTGIVRPIVFGPDGRTLTTEGDHAAHRWDITDFHHPTVLATLTGATDVACDQESEVICVASSPDGRILATGSTGPTLRLWDVTDPHRATTLATLTNLDGPIDGVAFGSGTPVLVTISSRNRIIRLWDITDPRHPRELATLTGHTEPVNTVAFSPDGRTLATTSYDRTVRLWDITDPRHPTTLSVITGHTDAVYSVAFRPDGRVLATTGQDQTVRLWNVADPRHPTELATLTGHTNFVNQPAFSPDGRTLATASGDHTVRLWNVADPRRPTELATLTAHADAVNDVMFSPDGRVLATGGYDHTARLWDLSIDRVAQRICDLAYPTITHAEWDQYFPDLAYQPPCQ